jgi:hypothetical protein
MKYASIAFLNETELLLTRPIVGIENRTAQEVFDIMADRFRHAVVDAEALRSAERGEWVQERVAFWSIEAFKRHVMNEWPQSGSITVEPHGGIDKRVGWDTHLVCVDGMAVGYTDRAVPGLSKVGED